MSEAAGEPTLKQQDERREVERRTEVAAHPLVQAVLDAFPGATIAAVRDRFAAAPAGTDGLETIDDATTEEDET